MSPIDVLIHVEDSDKSRPSGHGILEHRESLEACAILWSENSTNTKSFLHPQVLNKPRLKSRGKTQGLCDHHELIERELLELEAIMDAESINYPNLVHVVKKITFLWGHHTQQESELLVSLETHGYATSLNGMRFEQAALQRRLQSLTKKMLCCSDCQTRHALLTDGRAFITLMRAHIKKQDWIFYALPSVTIEHAARAANVVVHGKPELLYGAAAR